LLDLALRKKRGIIFEKARLDRRRFLGGAAVASSAALVPEAGAQVNFNAGSQPKKASLPTAVQMAAERNTPPELDKLTAERTGSDFMVDVCKMLEIDYIAACPGSTFRGLQKALSITERISNPNG
jgi:hypothetical protein